MTGTGELLALCCCDLGAIVRGRAIPATRLAEHLERGLGWVPANHALTPLGELAPDSPFDSTGDLRLLPDPDARARVQTGGASPLEVILCDIVELDGSPWPACPRTLLRRTLAELESELGVRVHASFEHEFQVRTDRAVLPAFSLAALRAAEPLPRLLMEAMAAGGLEPERIFAEYAPHQLELPIAPCPAAEAADRAVLLREIAREVARQAGAPITFTPLLDPGHAGNGVHLHISFRDGAGRNAMLDSSRAGNLSELGGSFAAGVLAHARALIALSAPSPVSAARLQPHRWSAGSACLADRNREALLRIPPLTSLGGADAESQMRLEYRGADAAANPHVALAAVLRAGLEGVRAGLGAPPLLEVDPATLGREEQERFGVGTLPSDLGEALDALAADDCLREWLGATLYGAHTAVKRSELASTSNLDPAEICRLYASVY